MNDAAKATTDRFSTKALGDGVLNYSTTLAEGRNRHMLTIPRDSTPMIVMDTAD